MASKSYFDTIFATSSTSSFTWTKSTLGTGMSFSNGTCEFQVIKSFKGWDVQPIHSWHWPHRWNAHGSPSCACLRMALTHFKTLKSSCTFTNSLANRTPRQSLRRILKVRECPLNARYYLQFCRVLSQGALREVLRLYRQRPRCRVPLPLRRFLWPIADREFSLKVLIYLGECICGFFTVE